MYPYILISLYWLIIAFASFMTAYTVGIILSRMLEETVQGKEQGTGIAGHAGDGYGGLGHHGGQNDLDVDQMEASVAVVVMMVMVWVTRPDQLRAV